MVGAGTADSSLTTTFVSGVEIAVVRHGRRASSSASAATGMLAVKASEYDTCAATAPATSGPSMVPTSKVT